MQEPDLFTESRVYSQPPRESSGLFPVPTRRVCDYGRLETRGPSQPALWTPSHMGERRDQGLQAPSALGKTSHG